MKRTSLKQWISCRPIFAILFCTFLLLSSGCTYLHNEANYTVAKETQSEFENFRKSSANPYSLMLQNLQKVKLKASQRQAEMAKQKASSFSAQVHTVTWEEIKTALKVEKTQQVERNEVLKKAVESLLKEKGEREAKVKDIEEGMKKVQALLEKAVKEQQKWEARQVLFRSTIKFLAETARQGKTLGPQTLKEAKEEILGQKITIEVLDAQGNLVSQESTVGKVLSDDIDALKKLEFGELLRKYTIGNFDPESAPGLTVTILSLGMDLAKAQLDRAKLEVNYLKARIDSLAVQIGNSRNIDTVLYIIKDRTKKGDFIPSDKVLDTVNALRVQLDKENAIQDAFVALAHYSVAQTLDESARLELQTRPASLEHEYSIQLSAINAREHEALIGRGLQGLATYHEGGVTPAMIANFLRAAQAAALAVIGAGVL